MKIAIIGGGIAGLSTALAFKKAGIDFHLFEQSPEFGEVGAGIGLSTSTFTILEKLGVGEDFLKIAVPLQRFVITNHQLKKVLNVPFDGVGFCIHRAKLIEVLSKPLLKDDYTLNAQIESIDEKESHIEIKSKEGITYKFDIVVAADGIHSSIRKKVFPQIQARYTGQTMWRGIAQINLPATFKNKMHELWGMNKRLGIVDVGNNNYFWYLVRFAQENQKDDEATIHSDLKKLVVEHHTYATNIIDATTNIIRTDLKDIEPGNYPWHTKRIVFVGDSIHACTPHLSQGGCQAIESAYTLSGCLKKYDTIEEAFTTFQSIRQEKIQFINELSYHFGRFNHQRKAWKDTLLQSVLSVLPEFYMRKKFEKTVDLKYLATVDL